MTVTEASWRDHWTDAVVDWAGAHGRLRLTTDGFWRELVGPIEHVGRLALHRLSDGWYATDHGLKGGLFFRGFEVESLPLLAGFTTTLNVGAVDGPAIELEVYFDPPTDFGQSSLALSHAADLR